MTGRTRRRFAAVACAVAVAAGCTGSGRGDEAPSAASTDPPRPVPLPGPDETPPPVAGLAPPPVPDRGAYLGAWSNPTRRTRSAAQAQAQAAFESLGISHVYARWDAPAPIAALERITSAGAVPLLDWACGPDDPIADGRQDDRIQAYAEALRRFGRPVFLRYAWEMNLDVTRGRECTGEDGAAGFVVAWRRVRRIFDQVGATNVAFVWCPGVEPTRETKTWGAYFPGAAFVDWIGIDGYVRDPDPAAAATAFSRVFGPFYDEFVGDGKPIMVAETGALAGAQAPYLSSLVTVLPQAFPQIKALVYFDARGPRGDWSLRADGLQAFTSLAADPYFSFHA